MTKTFEPPQRARHHCRHYSYELGLHGRGPLCALGLDLSAPAASGACMPLRAEGDTYPSPCAKREDWSDEERATWQAWQAASLERVSKAVAALPAPITLRTRGAVDCPNCDGGKLHFARWRRGAEIKCTTPYCCSAHFSIEAGKDWPAGGSK